MTDRCTVLIICKSDTCYGFTSTMFPWWARIRIGMARVMGRTLELPRKGHIPVLVPPGAIASVRVFPFAFRDPR